MADLAKAKILIELRRLEDAARELRAVLAVEPDNAEATTYLAQTAFLSRDYREAAAQCTNALRTAPKHQFALRIQALTLLHLDHHARARAEQSARRALALGPESAENHRILAIVLRERGRPADALEVIDRAAELDPADPDIHLVRGSVLRRLGRSGTRHRPGPAVAAYREALRLQPENAGAVHDLALVDLDRGRLRPALRGVLSAAAMDPTLVPLIRGNVAVVIRRAARRVHWCLAAIALLSLILGSFPDATAAGDEWPPDILPQMQAKSEQAAPHRYSSTASPRPNPPQAPQAAPVRSQLAGSSQLGLSLAGRQQSGSPVVGSSQSGLLLADWPQSGPLVAVWPQPGPPVAGSPQSGSQLAGSSQRGLLLAVWPQPGLSMVGWPQSGSLVVGSSQSGLLLAGWPQLDPPLAGWWRSGALQVGPAENGLAQDDPVQTGPQTTPSWPGGVGPGLPDGLTFPSIPTFPSLSPTPSEDIAPSRGRSGAGLGSAGRVVAGAGIGGLGLVAVWWLGVIPGRRRRFVLAAIWASTATATRLVVAGLGVVGCAVAAVSGLRGPLTLVFFLLVVAGVVLRRVL
ncbi:tetratricopeptide repeat protein [Nocardia terpenica]|uniref:tetratricopeptide repeat protein n=1 Tax=Nocardia terpenica TaxID=455432 RepID=UPI002FDFCE7C